MKTVYVVGQFIEYMVMFEENGWSCVDTIEDADLVQFCGGSDVNPTLYGEGRHLTTSCNLERDEYETKMYEMAFENHSAIAGICRGAQFVHVMNGGKLYQHVNKHATYEGHMAYIEVPKLMHFASFGVRVSSTHHQMMRMTAEGGDRGTQGTLLLSAREATFKETYTGTTYPEKQHSLDVEGVYHELTNSLCYQPHPEYFPKEHECQKLYFAFIEELLFNAD